MPNSLSTNQSLVNFANVKMYTNSCPCQHVDATVSRINRVNSDVEKLYDCSWTRQGQEQQKKTANTVFKDPTILFQRMCIMKKRDEDIERYLKTDLAPYPLALFDESGIKNSKSDFYEHFEHETATPHLTNATSLTVGIYYRK